MTFLDTSGLLAFLDRDASQHERVRASMAQVLRDRDAVTHNYVLVETEALAYRRLGARAVRALLEDVVPALKLVWVDADLHDAAVAAHLRALRRRSSLVDHVSFELMRRLDLRTALALDDDFAREGFELLPG
ncbi:MAG TPA: PIN domain-containing protein [Solirubrobacterales bacterium]|nr:PIN domain-containing protein [Solirubrobacterales bacterium]